MRRPLFIALVLIGSLTSVGGSALAQSTLPGIIVPAISSDSPGANAQSAAGSQRMDGSTPVCGFDYCGSPSPTAVPSAAPTLQSQIQSNILAKFITGLLTQFAASMGPLINASINFGLWLLQRVVVISMLLAVITWWMDGDSLTRIVGFFYKRVAWFVICAGILSTTWTFNGGPGWLPMIIVTLFNIGAAATNGAIQPLPLEGFQSNPVGGLTMLPGELLVMGGQMFTSLLQLGSAGQGGILGLLGTVVDTVVTGDALDPIMTAIGYIVTLLSAATCFIVCLFIAFRYTWTIMQVLYFGVFSFYQAALGSNRMAALGGAFIDGALSLGAELGMVAAFAGIGEVMIKGAIGYTPTNPFVTLIPFVGTGAKAASIGVMLVLDCLLVFWAWMVRSAPEFAQRLLSGGFSANMAQLSAALGSSGNPVARLAGSGMSALETGSTRGSGVLMAQSASKAVGAAGQLALGFAGGVGKAAGVAAAHGGLQGAMMGGVPGAVLGAVGGIMGSKMARPIDGSGGKEGAEGSPDSMRGAGRSSGTAGGDEMRGADRAQESKEGTSAVSDVTQAVAGVGASARAQFGSEGDVTRTQTVTTQVQDRTIHSAGGGEEASSTGAVGGGSAARTQSGRGGGSAALGGGGARGGASRSAAPGVGAGGGEAGGPGSGGSAGDGAGGAAGGAGGASGPTDGAFVNSGGYAYGVTPFGSEATGWKAVANGVATEAISGMRLHNSIGDLIARRAMYMAGSSAARQAPPVNEAPVGISVGSGFGQSK